MKKTIGLFIGLFTASSALAGTDRPITLKCNSWEKANSNVQIELNYELLPLDADEVVLGDNVIHYKSAGTINITKNGDSEKLLILQTSKNLDYFILGQGPYNSGKMPGGELKNISSVKTFKGTNQVELIYQNNLYFLFCSKEKSKN